MQDTINKLTSDLEKELSPFTMFNDCSLAGMWIHYDGVILYSNERFAALLEDQKENLIGNKIADYVHPNDQERLEIYLNPNDQDQFQANETDFCVLTTKGEVRWTTMQISNVAYQNLQIQVVSAVDVSYQKKLTRNLNEYNRAIEATDEMIAIIDKNHNYITANSAFLINRQLKQQDVIGHSLIEVLGEPDYTKIKGYLDKSFQGEVVQYESVSFHKKEGRMNFFIRYYPIFNTSGQVDRVVSVVKDITSLKQAEEVRQQIFALSVDLLAVISFDGNFKDINPAWYHTLGWSKAELLDKAVLDIIHPDDQKNAIDIVQQLIKGKLIKNFESRLKCKDESFRWVAWNASSYVHKGFIYAVARDVTQNKKDQETITLSNERLESLLILSQMKDVSEKEIREFALDAVVRLTRSKVGYLHYVNIMGKDIETTTYCKNVAEQCEITHLEHDVFEGEGIWAQCLKTRNAIVQNEYSIIQKDIKTPQSHIALTRHMCLPVFDKDQIVAIVGVGNKELPYRELDIQQSVLFMNSMWSILQQKKAEEILVKFSMEDGLTGLANRRYLDQVLEREWQRSVREKAPISIVFLDIDYFKTFNDIYGHQAGDECLRKVAQAFRKNVHRPGDVIARYGGEEFVVILTNTELDGAQNVAETLRQKVMDLNIPHHGSHVNVCVTISAGIVSAIPNESMAAKDLLEEADKALYQAKNSGRNRVRGNTKLL